MRDVEEILAEGDEAYELGRYHEALERYREAIEADSTLEAAHNNAGVCLEAMGKYEEAIKEYDKAIKINPRYETAWLNMGNSLLALGRKKESIEAYERAVEINPDYLDAHIAKCSALISMKRRRAALRYCEEVVREHEEPDYIEAKAFILQELGKYDDALKSLDRALSWGPTASLYNAKGNLLTLMERYEEAIENYNLALEIEPDNEEFWNNKGYAFFMIGLYDEAIESYDRAIQINPRYKAAWYNKGYTLHGIGRLEEAVKCYRMAVRYDEYDEVLWNNLGNALYNLGKYDESIPYFVRAIEVNPNYDIAWNNIGNALDRMGRHSESIEYHDRALAINKKFDYALYAKGYAMARAGNPEDGLDWIEKSLAINPKYDHAWFAKGHVLEMLGELPDAVEALKKALELNPDYPEAWDMLGRVYRELGRAQWAELCEAKVLISYRNLLEADPMDFNLRMNEIEYLMKMGHYDDVVDRCDEWMIIRPLDERAWKATIDALIEKSMGKDALVYLRRAEEKGISIDNVRKARIYGSLEHWNEALEVLGDEDSEDVHFWKSRALHELGRDKEAMEEIYSAASTADKWMLQGNILESLKRYHEAMIAYENANEIDESSSAWMGIARCRMQAGEAKKAREAAEIALSINPDDEEAWDFFNPKPPTEKAEKAVP